MTKFGRTREANNSNKSIFEHGLDVFPEVKIIIILSAFLRERELGNGLECWCLLHSQFSFLLVTCSRVLLLLRGGKEFQKPCSATFPYFVIFCCFWVLAFSSIGFHHILPIPNWKVNQVVSTKHAQNLYMKRKLICIFVFLGQLEQFYLHLCRNVWFYLSSSSPFTLLMNALIPHQQTC